MGKEGRRRINEVGKEGVQGRGRRRGERGKGGGSAHLDVIREGGGVDDDRGGSNRTGRGRGAGRNDEQSDGGECADGVEG